MRSFNRVLALPMSNRHYHVMLVEDSTTQAISLTDLLEREGWKVTWVTGAERAFSALREFRPDLILMDYHLPGIRGDEICRRIRMNVDTRRIPIVMLTSQKGQQVQGLDSGADDFVAKSTNPQELLVRLRTLLNKHEQEALIINGGESAFRDVHLLAIDDSLSFLERLSHELAGEGYKLETTTDPADGLKKLKAGTFDGVIIDLIMPGMDGFEVCRKVNELRSAVHMPLISILLTGADSTENLSKALDAGADDFVGKSSDFSILKGRIRALLRRKFFTEENTRILGEIKLKEMEALRERAAKEAAEGRAALVEELQARTEELNRSREELSRANAAKDQFLAMLSHELRTPLSPVLALVEDRCQDTALTEDLRADFQLIRRNIRLEAHLIDDLLDLTRITQGKLEIRAKPQDLQKIVAEAIQMCSSGQRPQAGIHFLQSSEPVFVNGDSVRLIQVVWNLLQNAIKFTPAEGRIEVRLSQERTREGQRVILEIQDTGIGISPDKIDRIFQAFQQESRNTTRLFGGLGLGLAISRAIVDLHEGSISARSEGLNKGATFRMELPALVAAPAFNSIETVPHESAVGSRVVGHHILLVEDHVDTGETLARLLRRRGHQVYLTRNVAEARDAAAATPEINVLITDFGLPDGSGYDVLKNLDPKRQIHAIVLSGFGMEQDVRKSLEAGFVHHLTKPVEIARLEAALPAG